MPHHVTVLFGGGIESTALVARAVARGHAVRPVHVSTGLRWDRAERDAVRRVLERLASPRIEPVAEVTLDLGGALSSHWAVNGADVPTGASNGMALELPLRNLTLVTAAMPHAWRQNGPVHLAIGTTRDNHFPDGSREFFDATERVLSISAGRAVYIDTPFIGMTKADVIRDTPRDVLALSWSCVDPAGSRHCGTCLKCVRRREAFAAAGVADPTEYAG